MTPKFENDTGSYQLRSGNQSWFPSYVARNAERCLPKILSGVLHREMKINKLCVQYISRSLNHREGKYVANNRAL